MFEAGNPNLVLWDQRDGKGREEGGRIQREGTNDVYLCPIHVDVWQKHHNTVK